MKKLTSFILLLTSIVALCSMLLGCEKTYDDKAHDFLCDNCDEQFNAIKIELGNDTEAVYFIDQGYGIWIDDEETIMFDIENTLKNQGRGDILIRKFTPVSYYKSIVEMSNNRFTGYYGDIIFSGYAHFSDNETIATFAPDNIHINKMSVESNNTIIMTKIALSTDEIIPFDAALDSMNYVPDAYFEFIAGKTASRYSCEKADFWIDASTMTGEWNTNGSIVPIRMQMSDKVPYIEIFDTSGSSEILIMKAYAKVLNKSSIELVEPIGEIFYITPTDSVTITKTN